MKRKDLWARLSSCTMAALIATTSVVPTYGADFSDGTVMEQTQETEDVAEADTVEGSADAGGLRVCPEGNFGGRT